MEFAHLRPESLADHERIVKLIRSGEAESAARALETHWYRSIDFLGEGDPVP
jgi:DNA-binding FadR family transcriptional regulator